MMYVGIDLGIDTCSASILDEQGNIKECLDFVNDSAGWGKLETAMDTDVKIAMEACTAAYPIYDHLVSKGYSVFVAHPAAVGAITQNKSITDDKASYILANLLRLNYLPLAYIPSPQTIMIRDILRTRIKTGQEITRTKNRIHGFLAKNGKREIIRRKKCIFGKSGRAILNDIRFNDPRDCILKTMFATMDNLTAQRKVLDEEIAKISIDNPFVNLLMTIPGIDYYSALIIVNEIGDIDRFKDASSLCMYAGLVPSVHSSCNVTRMGRITKRGPPMLRWVLTVNVNKINKYNNPITQFYRRIANKKKSKKVAYVAAARKLLVMIYYMLKNRESCRWEVPELTDRKKKTLQKTCQRKALKA